MNIIERTRGLRLVSATKWTESNTIDQIAHTSVQLTFENDPEIDQDDNYLSVSYSITSEYYNEIKRELPWYDDHFRMIEDLKEMNENFGKDEPK